MPNKGVLIILVCGLLIVNQQIALAQFFGSINSDQVRYSRSGPGTVAATVQSKLREVVSITDFGAVSGDGIDDTAAFTAAIATAVDPYGIEIRIPPGIFNIISGGILIDKQRIRIRGAGTHNSYLLVAPTATFTLFEYNATGAEATSTQCSLEDFGIASGDTTYQKTAIRVHNSSEFLVRNVAILGFVGQFSAGLEWYGRDAGTFNKFSVNADLPIYIGNNTAGNAEEDNIDIDHVVFRDLYMIGTAANPLITIADGINLSNVTFEGYQAWVLGGYGIYWNDTTSTQYSLNLHISNARWEQSTNASGYMYYINRAAAGKLQGLSIQNSYSGDANDHHHMFLSGTINTHLDTVSYAGTGECLNTADEIEFTNVWCQTGGSFNAPVSTVWDTGGSLKVSNTGRAHFGSGFTQASGATVAVGRSSTYSSEATAGLRIEAPTSDTAMLFGADAAADLGYMQCMDPGTSYSTRPCVINPNGGNLGVGTTTVDDKLDVNGVVDAATGYKQGGTALASTHLSDTSSLIRTTSTIAEYLNVDLALCQNATPVLLVSTPTSNAPSAACVTGSNTQFGVLQFDADTDESIQGHFLLAPLWTGAIDVAVKWRAAATADNVVWSIQTACVADAQVADPAWNTASAFTADAAKGTTLQANDASAAGITITGCAAGEELFWKFLRDADNGSDTMTGDAELIGLQFTTRRTVQ